MKLLPNGRIVYSYKGQLWEMDKDGANAVQRTEIEGGMQNVRISRTARISFSPKK